MNQRSDKRDDQPDPCTSGPAEEIEVNNLQWECFPARRRRLPETRQSVTHKFSVSGQEGYVTVGLYDDGRPGEMFIKIAKEGSTLGGLMDTIGVVTSLALQYGVPVEKLAEKLSGTRFEPAGHTGNPQLPTASSLSDYLFRWLADNFSDDQTEPPLDDNQ